MKFRTFFLRFGAIFDWTGGEFGFFKALFFVYFFLTETPMPTILVC